jgi:hypothetical protein
MTALAFSSAGKQRTIFASSRLWQAQTDPGAQAINQSLTSSEFRSIALSSPWQTLSHSLSASGGLNLVVMGEAQVTTGAVVAGTGSWTAGAVVAETGSWTSGAVVAGTGSWTVGAVVAGTGSWTVGAVVAETGSWTVGAVVAETGSWTAGALAEGGGSTATFPQTLNTPTDALVTELEELRELPDDWDGEGAAAPNPGAIDQTISFVRSIGDVASRLEPTPDVDGSILLEINDGDLGSFRFRGDNTVVYAIRGDLPGIAKLGETIPKKILKALHKE